MAIGKSIRIYELAKEVKQDTKRVMEDVRREGAEVSVASNTVTHEIAEKVRNKYLPKVEVAPKRGIKVIKKAARPEDPQIAEPEISSPESVVEDVPTPIAVKKKVAEPIREEEPKDAPKVRRLAKKS